MVPENDRLSSLKGIMMITQPGLNMLKTVSDALCGGVSIVQYRDKKATDADFLEMAKRLLALTTSRGVPLIVNDRLPIAQRLGVGIHVGMSDISPRLARSVLGPKPLIGLTVHNRPDLIAAYGEWIDYVGCGPVYETKTKKDARSTIGLQGLASICAVSPKPVIAIGGIDLDNIRPTWDNGASGVAVCAAISMAANPRLASRQLAQTSPFFTT